MAVCSDQREKCNRYTKISAEGMDVQNIKDCLRAHRRPEFWREKSGSELAYVRWWSSMVRREARLRGLL